MKHAEYVAILPSTRGTRWRRLEHRGKSEERNEVLKAYVAEHGKKIEQPTEQAI